MTLVDGSAAKVKMCTGVAQDSGRRIRNGNYGES
jgi:hypothetical protein